MRNMITIALLLALAGCCCSCASKGAGGSQDPCGLAATVEKATPGGGQAIAQAVKGGQESMTDQHMADAMPTSPGVTWGGGQGNVDATNTWQNERAMSGAPSVNQGLIIPAEANAQQAGGISPAVTEAQKNATAARNAWMCAASDPCASPERIQALYVAMREMGEALSHAEACSRSTISHVWNLQGATTAQNVANSSASNSKPVATEAGDSGTQPTRAMKMLESLPAAAPPPPTPAAALESAPNTLGSPPPCAPPCPKPCDPPAGVAVPR